MKQNRKKRFEDKIKKQMFDLLINAANSSNKLNWTWIRPDRPLNGDSQDA